MSFQVVYETSSRLIIGVGPFDPGWTAPDGYAVATLDDSQQGAVLMASTAYLCSDGQTVQPQPC